MQKIIKLRQIISSVGLMLWFSAGFAADPIPTYRLVNGGSAASDIKVLNLSSASNTISGANGNTFSSFAVSAGAVGTISSGMTAGGSITGTGPFLAMGTGDGTGTPLFVPGFAGQIFVIPHHQGNHKYYLYNPTGSAISVTVTLNGTPDTFNLASGLTEYDAGSTNTISGIVTAASDIYVAHRENGGTTYAYAVPPAAQEVLGVKSGTVLLGAYVNGTSVTVYTSGDATSTINLDAGERVVVTTGSSATQGSGNALRLVSSDVAKPIAAIQVDDGDGDQATAFWSESLLSMHSGLAVDTQYVAVVCKDSAVIKLHDGATTTTQNCTANGNYPGKAYFGSTSNGVSIYAGARLESSVPVYYVAENASNNDESTLWSYEPDIIPVNTTTASAITANTTWHTGKVYSIGSDLTINSGVTLTIEPGVVMIATGAANDILVDGTLVVQGTAVAPVLFTTEEASNPSSGSSQWQGIWVKPGATATFDYAEIARANHGVEFDHTGSAGYIANSYLHHNVQAIYLYKDAYPSITYSDIDNNYYGIEINPTMTLIHNPAAAINHNTINGNINAIRITGADVTLADAKPVVQYNDLSGNTKAYLLAGSFAPSTADLTTLNAKYNWWGTTVVTDIGTVITDEIDTTTIDAVVDFNLFALDASVSTFSSNQVLVGRHDNETISLAANNSHTQFGSLILGSGTKLTVGEGSTYNFFNDNSKVVIEDGATMTINKNSNINIQSSAANQTSSFDVYGILNIEGEPLNYVMLKTNQATLSKSTKYWDGIKVMTGGEAYLDYVVLQQSDGLHFYDGAWGVISNSHFNNNKYGVYLIGDADILSYGNTYQTNTTGVYIEGGYTGSGEHQPKPVFIWDVITDNTTGIFVKGTNNINEPDPGIGGAIVAFNSGCNGTTSQCNYVLAGTWANPGHVMQTTQCYWGYDNYADVAALAIYDHTDSVALPYVNYGQIFTDITSSDAQQEFGETLVGVISTNTILAENQSYTLLSTLQISNSSTLSVPAGSTLLVPSGFDINVDAGSTLTLGEGASVIFEGTASKITVSGTLTVTGTSTSPAVFSSSAPGKGKWYGIDVLSGATANFTYATIENSINGIYFHDNSAGTVTHSTVTNNSAYGILIQGHSSPDITYSTISNNGAYNGPTPSAGITILSGGSTGYSAPQINHNSLSGNYYGIRVIAANNIAYDPRPVINYNNFGDDISASILMQGTFANYKSVVIDAKSNWWGSTELRKIAGKIFDYQSSTINAPLSVPLVDYSHYALDSNLSSFKSNTLIGPIAANTTLTTGNSYIVLGDLSVPQGKTLTIQAGVQLLIPRLLVPNAGHPKHLVNISVAGVLSAVGDDTSGKVKFTSLENFPADGDWDGLTVMAGGQLNLYKAIVEYGDNAIVFDDGADSRSDVLNSIVQYNTGPAITFVGGVTLFGGDTTGISIMGNTLSDSQYGIYAHSSTTNQFTPPRFHVISNVIKNSSMWGISLAGPSNNNSNFDPLPVINDNIFTNNGSYQCCNLRVVANSFSSAVNSLNATHNMWGVTDPQTIAARISDKADADPSYKDKTPQVNFTDFALDYDLAISSTANDVLGGTVNYDLTLPAYTYITIIGDLNITSDGKLTLQKGTQIYFADNYAINVDGILDVNGTADEPVVFASDDISPAINDWNGISVNPAGASGSSAVAEIDYAVIQHATTGVTFNKVPLSAVYNSVTYYNRINHSVLQENDIGAKFISTPAGLPITNNLIQFNNYGLYFQGSGGANVQNNSITYNTRGIYLLGDSGSSTNTPTPVINSNDIYGNSYAQLEMYNYPSGVTVDLQSNWWGTSTPTVASNGTIKITGTTQASNADVANAKTSVQYNAATARLTLSQDYISPNADSIQDTVAITGSLIQSANWAVIIRDYYGAQIKTYTGSGTSVSVTWDGKNTSNTAVADGLYRAELWLIDPNQLPAVVLMSLLASDNVNVDNTAPVARIDNLNNTTITAMGPKSIQGRATDSYIANYNLKYKKVGNSTWTTISNVNYWSTFDAEIGSWVLGGPTVAPPSNGVYDVLLTVSDLAGNVSTATVSVTLDLMALTNVTQNYKTVDIATSDFVVTFTLGADADWVKMQIYPERGGALIREIQVNNLTAGTGRTISWDGKDANGNYVPREAYEFILIADAANSSSQYVYDPVKVYAGGTFGPCYFALTSVSADGTFNVYSNDVWKSTMTVQSSSACADGFRIRLRAQPTSAPYAYTWVLNQVPYSPGSFPITWDGVDVNGLRVQGSVAMYAPDPIFPYLWADMALVPNAVIIDPSGLAPKIKGGTLSAPTIEVKSDPYLIYYSYDQFLNMKYNLDKESYVVITLLPPGVTSVTDANAVQVYNSGTCSLCSVSGDKTLTWYGHDTTDTNNMLISKEGLYYYVIEAIAVSGGAKSTVKGVVNLYK